MATTHLFLNLAEEPSLLCAGVVKLHLSLQMCKHYSHKFTAGFKLMSKHATTFTHGWGLALVLVARTVFTFCFLLLFAAAFSQRLQWQAAHPAEEDHREDGNVRDRREALWHHQRSGKFRRTPHHCKLLSHSRFKVSRFNYWKSNCFNPFLPVHEVFKQL